MDSLTQMVLGAACGEAVLGRKIGNKALIWGAFAGTIPDLDVLSNFFMGDLDALAFHRGPMHSLLFACIMPFPLAWMVLKFYGSGIYNRKEYRTVGFITSTLFFILMAGILSFLLIFLIGSKGYFLPVLLAIGLYFLIKELYKEYLTKDQEHPQVSYKEWAWLFFYAIVTHPILDAFTTFGTRLFWPFSDVRVSLSNISIVDPIYTIPFLATVIACGFYSRTDRRRQITNWVGIGVSCFYMMATMSTRKHVDKVMESSLSKQGIVPDKMISTPTIFNNILWFSIAQKDSNYYCGYYSLFDKERKIDSIRVLPQNQYLVKEFMDQKELKILTWFSEQYYNLMDLGNGRLQYNDLRYGTLSFKFDDPKDFIFHFNLTREGDHLKVLPERERPNRDPEELQKFWERLKGN
ncbi:MAG: metal-dependent hydrolase [Saprospiraceae bacterium]|nr:metal-dependent hydrolase [Saprospiraceae bacterium]MCC6843729.1 metal-dependent hydrolase [Saprospiraceae bacterium]